MKRTKIRELEGEKIQKRLSELRKEISLLQVEQKTKQDKNTNAMGLKRKEVARLLTKLRNKVVIQQEVTN